MPVNKNIDIPINVQPLQILHLDDHRIFADGLVNAVRKWFPNAVFKNIQNGDEALAYVKSILVLNKKLDLIVTDINHPGLHGIEFATEVRIIEKAFGRRTPILFITMVDDDYTREKAENIPLVKYVTKTTSPEDISLAINELV